MMDQYGNHMNLKWLWKRLTERKAHSNLSLSQIPIRLESPQEVDKRLDHQLKQQSQLGGFQSNLPSPSSQASKPTYPYWCSFRDPEDNFVGVVICRGTSPGNAANSVIVRGIVESERATIKQLTELHYGLMIGFAYRLLDERSAMLAAEAGGFANQMQRDVKLVDNNIEQ